jgi:hypothetical protein
MGSLLLELTSRAHAPSVHSYVRSSDEPVAGLRRPHFVVRRLRRVDKVLSSVLGSVNLSEQRKNARSSGDAQSYDCRLTHFSNLRVTLGRPTKRCQPMLIDCLDSEVSGEQTGCGCLSTDRPNGD